MIGANFPPTQPLLTKMLIVTLVLFTCLFSGAQVPGPKVSQLAHTAWRMREGSLIGDPQAIGQTTDGYLWVGTSQGLLRFDGIQFQSIDKIAGVSFNESVSALRGAEDGSLWIGTDRGLKRWKNNAFQPSPGDSLGRVNNIIEGQDGTIWVARTRPVDQNGPLCSIRGNALRCYSAKDGLPCLYGQELFEDRVGAIWMSSDPGICRWSPQGSTILLPPGAQGGHETYTASITQVPDGTKLFAYTSPGKGLGLQEQHDDRVIPYPVEGFDPTSIGAVYLLADSSGCVWTGTDTQGLFHICNGVLDRYDASDGLTSKQINALFEDREGNVWVATSNGLDRFHAFKVVTLSMHDGLISDQAMSVVKQPDGTMLVGAIGGLNTFKNGIVQTLRSGHGFPGVAVTSMFVDGAGDTFVGIDERLTRYKNGIFAPITISGASAAGQIMRMAEDSHHVVWAIGRSPAKLLRVVGDHAWAVAEAGSSMRNVLAIDAQDRIWMQLNDGSMVYYSQGALHAVGSGSSKLRLGGLTTGPDGFLWAWSRVGLSSFRSGQWITLDSTRGLPCDRVTECRR